MDIDTVSDQYDSNDSDSIDMYAKMCRQFETQKDQWPAIISSSSPSEHLPQHILTILTDECIQHILCFLIGNIRDFLSAAEVCKRFQENAKKCFPSIYQDFCIVRPFWNYHLPLNDVIRFLKIFGYLIRSIKWDRTYVRCSSSILSFDVEMFETIAKYCGNNLIKFECDHHDFDFNNGSDFSAIEVLEIGLGTISNFKIPFGLKKLLLRCTDIGIFDYNIKVPTLNKAVFVNVNQFNDRCLLEFLRLNSQLECLEFSYFDHNITLPILEEIPHLTPNLIQLHIHTRRWPDANFIPITTLRRLKSLNLEFFIIPSELIDSMIENRMALEDLEINVQSVSNQSLQNLQELIQLKHLTLWKVKNEEIIIEIVKKLPLLKQFTIYSTNGMTLDGVKKILEHGKCLRKFYLKEENITVNLDDYQTILRLAKHRVKVELEFMKGEIQFDHKIIENNSKWLEISYDYD